MTVAERFYGKTMPELVKSNKKVAEQQARTNDLLERMVELMYEQHREPTIIDLSAWTDVICDRVKSGVASDVMESADWSAMFRDTIQAALADLFHADLPTVNTLKEG